jgi:hypothetical protein
MLSFLQNAARKVKPFATPIGEWWFIFKQDADFLVKINSYEYNCLLIKPRIFIIAVI